MPPSDTAHLRNCRLLLQRALAENPEAAVYLGAQRLGTVGEVRFRWMTYGQRIRVQFVAGGREVGHWVSTVKRARGGVELRLASGSRMPPGRLYVMCGPGEQPGCGSGDLWQTLRAWLTVQYPGVWIRSVKQTSDRRHTISGSFLRVRFRHEGREFALLACDPALGGPDGHTVLTHALLWLELMSSRRDKTAPALLVVVPPSLGPVVGHCNRLLKVRIGVWQIETGDGRDRIERTASPAAPIENRDFRWPVLGPFRWSAQLSRVLELAPELIRRYPRFDDYDSLRLHGLEFARATGDDRGRILFGVGSQQTELTDENLEELRALVNEILYFRRADSPSTRHPYYTVQAERWLESLILESAPRLFPELAPEAVYSQIPVYLGKDAGRVDVLGVDREGTLVVMELKVTANPDLPLQALDYWGRVTQHNNRGDFERRGYFAEVRLTRRPPTIYLVAPVFSFHDSTERIVRYLDPSLEVWKVALNEDWRSGVRVLRRTLVKCGRERNRE